MLSLLTEQVNPLLRSYPLTNLKFSPDLPPERIQANSRRKEALSEMTVGDWRLVVNRETQADLWYEEPESDEEIPTHTIMPTDLNRRNGNGIFPNVSAAIGSGAV
jgi:hypothetical protein